MSLVPWHMPSATSKLLGQTPPVSMNRNRNVADTIG